MDGIMGGMSGVLGRGEAVHNHEDDALLRW
jgi:hypothetical protein